MTVREACDVYLRELEARNARSSTIESYRYLFPQMEAFAGRSGLDSIEELDRAALRNWREQWTWAPSTQRRVLAQLRAFFSFACKEGWIAESPAENIRAPRSDSRPTMPLSAGEMRAMLAASTPLPATRALLLLMRYSGLAILDAATLHKDALTDTGEVVTRRAKSGELVTVALPDQALAALEAASEPGRRHYFWSGRSKPVTAAKLWRSRLAAVAAEAGVEGFHPHRLRDTFAVELLLAGVLIQDVSTLLGHSSVATTERHYAPWNLARRARLAAVVRKAHQQDPILLEFTPKKPARSEATPPAEAGLANTQRSQATRAAYE